MKEKITAKIQSNKGFYVGDICYALADDTYHGVWGEADYEDGIYEVPGTGFSFAAAGTAYGDGTYQDEYGRVYSVDAGNIGIVPLELVEKNISSENVWYTPGEATFEACEGIFNIEMPDGDEFTINTGYETDYDY